MENGLITDVQISASEPSPLKSAIFGRLHSPSAWSARKADGNQWLQIDLGIKWAPVTRVATQRREDGREWVTKYTLWHSNYLTKWPKKWKGEVGTRMFNMFITCDSPSYCRLRK